MRNRLSRALPVAVAVLAAVTVALPVSAAAATATAAVPVSLTAPADHATYIVTVHPGLDPAAVADAYGITPLHVYRDTLNGFAARLSPEQVDALRTTAVVKSVEEDGGASSFGPAV
ncbi:MULTISPECIES: protease inhibitor I9 family protein [unclassified Streptomyces]|uniref:protease inhibitor I9 family protein n=1 Tax=unclassified Streptomyces TaxID=2593676 RepID=UPI00224FD724|nr:protease inhibitor I9 family protein [Streptomyces sp. NBC_00047]MCX5606533.1 protease inhibitor I9 family protein [Streptomyces sp. NBC_00047]